MSGIYRELNAKGFESIEAAVNPTPQVPQFIQRYNVPFPVGTGNDNKAREFMQISMMMNAYVPWVVFIDRAGTIRNQYFGNDVAFNDQGATFRRELEKLLAERTPSNTKAAPKKAAAKKS
jgi:hypothetical protein